MVGAGRWPIGLAMGFVVKGENGSMVAVLRDRDCGVFAASAAVSREVAASVAVWLRYLDPARSLYGSSP